MKHEKALRVHLQRTEAGRLRKGWHVGPHRNQLRRIFVQSRRILDAQRPASAAVNVFRREFMPGTGHYSLAGYQVDKQGSEYHIQASINDGEQLLLIHGHGTGAISAFADAVHKATGTDIQVVQFDEQALAEGSDASAMAFIQANIHGQRYTAAAQDGDTLSASLNAMLNTVNKAMIDSYAVA